MKTRNCIYGINCVDCSTEYIEQTAGESGVIIAEHHKKAQHFPRNKVQYNALVKDSAIAGHAMDRECNRLFQCKNIKTWPCMSVGTNTDRNLRDN